MKLTLPIVLAGCVDYGLSKPPDPVVATDTGTPETTEPGCPLGPPEPYVVPVDDSCVQPPVIGVFDPVVEWNWNTNPIHPGYEQVMAAPAVANLTDDNADGAIDDADVPDVVFTSFLGSGYGSPGAVTAISGADGSTLWSVLDSQGYQPYGAGGVAIADLEGDGIPEVLVVAVGGLLALRGGAFAWFTPLAIPAFSFPSAADVDGDGTAEVVIGATVVDAAGAIRWTGVGGTGGSTWGSFAVDIEGDGLLEVIAGNTVYEHDGAVRWNDGQPDGFPAVGDFDGDGAPEFVRVFGGTVLLSDGDGTPIWSFPLTDGGGGPPTVADFDGDGEPEVGVASRSVYRVIETDGTERWQVAVQDFSSSVTGSSVFDFEGDGAAEVVYADEETLWVYDGATGTVELAITEHSSGTLFEYPVIVDVDQDGAAEIVVAANDYAFAGSRGITVIGDRTSSWAPARDVWNQHAYHITNVEDDGSIPRMQAPNWQSWNSFRAGNSETEQGLGLPDWSVDSPDVCTVECGADEVELWFPVENRGVRDGGPVQLVVSRISGGSATTLVVVEVGTVPAGTMTWVGPVPLAPQNFGDGGIMAEVLPPSVLAGEADCDATNNLVVVPTYPCP